MSLDDPEGLAARLLHGRWLLPVAAVAVVLVLVLASVPWWHNRFALHTVSESVTLTASAGATHSIGVALPAGTEIRIQNANPLSAPPELATLTPSPNGIRLVADKAVLNDLVLTDGAMLTVATTDGAPDLRLAGVGSITINLAGAIQQILPDGTKRTLATASRDIPFAARPAEGKVLRVVLVGAGALKGVVLYDQPAGDLRFSRPDTGTGDAARPFQSTIISGKLRLLDTEKDQALEPRDRIWLTDVEATVARLEWAGDGVILDASGQATSIGLGPPRPRDPARPDRDLTPSLLGYLLDQHELKVIWGAAIAVLLALWKARQWALKWGK